MSPHNVPHGEDKDLMLPPQPDLSAKAAGKFPRQSEAGQSTVPLPSADVTCEAERHDRARFLLAAAARVIERSLSIPHKLERMSKLAVEQRQAGETVQAQETLTQAIALYESVRMNGSGRKAVFNLLAAAIRTRDFSGAGRLTAAFDWCDCVAAAQLLQYAAAAYLHIGAGAAAGQCFAKALQYAEAAEDDPEKRQRRIAEIVACQVTSAAAAADSDLVTSALVAAGQKIASDELRYRLLMKMGETLAKSELRELAPEVFEQAANAWWRANRFVSMRDAGRFTAMRARHAVERTAAGDAPGALAAAARIELRMERAAVIGSIAGAQLALGDTQGAKETALLAAMTARGPKLLSWYHGLFHRSMVVAVFADAAAVLASAGDSAAAIALAEEGATRVWAVLDPEAREELRFGLACAYLKAGDEAKAEQQLDSVTAAGLREQYRRTRVELMVTGARLDDAEALARTLSGDERTDAMLALTVGRLHAGDFSGALRVAAENVGAQAEGLKCFIAEFHEKQRCDPAGLEDYYRIQQLFSCLGDAYRLDPVTRSRFLVTLWCSAAVNQAAAGDGRCMRTAFKEARKVIALSPIPSERDELLAILAEAQVTGGRFASALRTTDRIRPGHVRERVLDVLFGKMLEAAARMC